MLCSVSSFQKLLNNLFLSALKFCQLLWVFVAVQFLVAWHLIVIDIVVEHVQHAGGIALLYYRILVVCNALNYTIQNKKVLLFDRFGDATVFSPLYLRIWSVKVIQMISYLVFVALVVP